MLLDREIQDAHHSLLEPTPQRTKSAAEPLTSSQQLFNSSAPSRPSNRRATTNFGERKPLKTYGRASRDDSQLRSSGSAIEDAPGKQAQQGAEAMMLQGREMTPPQMLNIGLSVFNDIRRDRGASFANPQETQRLSQPMETDSEEAKMVSLVSSSMVTPFLQFARNVHTVDVDLGPISNALAEDQAALKKITQIDHNKLSNSISASSSDRPLRLVGNPQDHDQDNAILKMHHSPQINESDPSLPEQCNEESGLNKSHLLSEATISESLTKKPEDGELDELSCIVSISSVHNSNPNLSNSKFPIKNGKSLLDGPGSDDITIGLPAEQYKPRPSRSRSGRADVDLIIPADFSKRPETLAKRKKNRRKTTAFERPKNESEDDIEAVETKHPIVMIESQFEEASTTKDSKEKAIPVEKTKDLPQVQDGELRAKGSSPKKRGRPKKHLQQSSEEPIPPKSQAKHLTTQSKCSIAPVAAPTNTQCKKRKASIGPGPLGISNSESSDEDICPNLNTRHQKTVPLKEASGPNHFPSPSPSTNSLPGFSSFLSPTKTLDPPPQTPQKISKGPDKHSPLNSGKVPYRVGLSKRARIEPLLRIVRK